MATDPFITDCVAFIGRHRSTIARTLSRMVAIRSHSGEERPLARFIISLVRRDKQLFPGTADVSIVRGNVIIRIGHKRAPILFDAHLDTVPVADPDHWRHPPFAGHIAGGAVHGRGSCDDKASVTAMLFAAAFLHQHIRAAAAGREHCAATFSFSVNEEVSLGGVRDVLRVVSPRAVVIGEPSNLRVVRGHKGKWAFRAVFSGRSAHASVPERGDNAIYRAQQLVNAVQRAAMHARPVPPLGRPVCSVTGIESQSNSVNTIPSRCTVTVDYRSVVGETERSVRARLLAGVPASRCRIEPLHPFLPAWVLEKHHPLLVAALAARRAVGDRSPAVRWPFCTNGSITMGMHGIPTIGFGPGDPMRAHTTDESVPLREVEEAAVGYALLARNAAHVL